MGRFKGGVSVNHPKGSRTKDGKETKQKYHQIRAGPQRGQYVHDLIAEAKLGRPLEGDETAEHKDGNGLNIDPSNIIVVTRKVNVRLRYIREKRARAKENGQGDMPWENQF